MTLPYYMTPRYLRAIRYGVFECCPVIFNHYEAYVLFDSDKHWTKMNVAEILFNAGVVREETFKGAYGKLPPLPMTVFKSPSRLPPLPTTAFKPHGWF
jgi:hypothetical protein